MELLVIVQPPIDPFVKAHVNPLIYPTFMILALILVASSFVDEMLPAAILSALSVPVVMLLALIATAFTWFAVSVPV